MLIDGAREWSRSALQAWRICHLDGSIHQHRHCICHSPIVGRKEQHNVHPFLDSHSCRFRIELLSSSRSPPSRRNLPWGWSAGGNQCIDLADIGGIPGRVLHKFWIQWCRSHIGMQCSRNRCSSCSPRLHSALPWGWMAHSIPCIDDCPRFCNRGWCCLDKRCWSRNDLLCICCRLLWSHQGITDSPICLSCISRRQSGRNLCCENDYLRHSWYTFRWSPSPDSPWFLTLCTRRIGGWGRGPCCILCMFPWDPWILISSNQRKWWAHTHRCRWKWVCSLSIIGKGIQYSHSLQVDEVAYW